jgi:hypothetical protein
VALNWKHGLSIRCSVASGWFGKLLLVAFARLLPPAPLLAALGYEVVFAIPVSDLFAGMREAVEQGIEARLDELEKDLRQEQERGGERTEALNWIASRRGSFHASSR